MSEYTKMRGFLSAASLRFQNHKSKIAQDISLALADDLKLNQKRIPEAAPVNVSLPDFLPMKQTNLTRCLVTCADSLSWREAGFGKLPKEFSKRIFASELIGPNGLFESTNIRIGLLIQHEQIAYPKHWHEAEELYLILNGNAYWNIDDDPAVLCSPDSFVHHKSHQPHSMATQAEPLLALWGWIGDIDGKSYSI
jgi:dimethylpropiothetin dethiomethylase